MFEIRVLKADPSCKGSGIRGKSILNPLRNAHVFRLVTGNTVKWIGDSDN